jgi:phosphoribosylamine---glycine ligase
VNILFISKDLNAGNLAHLLVKEGHSVKLFIENKKSRSNFDNMVPQVKNWRAELSWVGKDGLIVFDDIGYGPIQDRLRKQGYTVFGGSEMGEKLEADREYGQKMFRECGMQTVELKDFENIDDAAMFVKANPDEWVIKTDNGNGKFYSYVGDMKNGEDVLALLRNYLLHSPMNKKPVTLHKRVHGVEVGVGRYFNGTDWVGPIEFNIEHVRFMPGDIGPTTSEMGTLAWYDTDEDNKLYKETLARMKPILAKSGFRGDFEINCIANETGIYPLEATARFGTPIIHLHTELHESPWGEFLHAVASGKQYDLKWRKGHGIVVLLAVPPFPFSKKSKEHDNFGIRIHFKDMSAEEFRHLHFEEVSLSTFEKDQYYITDRQGYIMYVTSVAPTVQEAQKKAYGLIKKIVIPKMMYRNDIGSRFVNESEGQLKKWGYL